VVRKRNTVGYGSFEPCKKHLLGWLIPKYKHQTQIKMFIIKSGTDLA